MQHLIKYAHQVRKSKHWQHTLYVMVVASMVLSLGQFSAPQTASAADTGWENPSQTEGDIAVSEADEAYTNNYNGNNNQVVEFSQNKTQIYKQYGFNIPSGAVINGVEVQLEDVFAGSTSGNRVLTVEISGDGGSTYSTTGNNTGDVDYDSDHRHDYILGGSANTWGLTLSQASFSNSNFRVRISSNNFGDSNRRVYIDWIPVKVYYTETGSISGYKWNDQNGSGVKGPSEPKLSGWTIKLYNAQQVEVASTVTNGSGDYSFTGLAFGTYSVCEVQQAGWMRTYPNASDCQSVTVSEQHKNKTDIKFGNKQTQCGDGNVEGSEQCDDDNSVDNDSCNNLCILNYCGDGITNNGEQCDDGNQVNNDACSNSCTVPDRDQDGIPDSQDNCPSVANQDQTDNDADGVGNACDNCPSVVNQDQADADVDGIGDVCEITTETQCEDGIDNDGDKAVDCADTDCANDQACQQPVCTPGVVTIPNGDFEKPVVGSGQWNIFPSGTTDLGWTVGWAGAYEGALEPANLELHNGVGGWTSGTGQYAELDTDWDGPSGSTNNEQASVVISQDIDVIPYATYELTYKLAPRPGYNASQNSVRAEFGFINETNSLDGSANSDIVWQTFSYSMTNDGSTTHSLKFTDLGTPDSFGMFIDDVKLKLIECSFPKATVIAHKIVCNRESDLPNRSDGAQITASTAQDLVNSSEGACHFEPNWKFEWGTNDSLLALNGDYTGEHNVTGWYDFDTLTDANGKTQVTLNLDEVEGKVWFREVLQPGYIPFSFPSAEYPTAPGSDVSAEFWCNKDVLNYDNAEWVQGLEENDVVYCVAMNVLKPQGPNGSICGMKIDDKDKDMYQDDNEQFLSGWDITLQEKTQCEKGDEWADEVISYTPGTQKGGGALPDDRDNPTNALGVAQYNDTINFVSLGFGGELVLKFSNFIENGVGDDLEIVETSYNSPSCASYPEQVRVFASQDGINWTQLGEGCLDDTYNLGSLSWAQYVKLVDISDVNDSHFPSEADGYDIDGVRALNCMNASEVVATDTTDEGGEYCFTGLKKGQYFVCEQMKEGWTNVSPLCDQVELTEENMSVGVDFFNYQSVIQEPTGDIHGYKWNDENNNGERDCEYPVYDLLPAISLDIQTPGPICEPKLSGWTIFIDKDGDGALDDGEQSTTTSSEDNEHFGWYWFENLPYGEYSICEVQQSGWTQTYPTNPSCHTVTLPDENPLKLRESLNAVYAPEYNFGNYQDPGCIENCVTGGGSETSGGGTPSSSSQPGPTVLGFTDTFPTLEKSVDQAQVNPGGTLHYTIVVNNTSDKTLLNVVLTDTLPAGFTFADDGTTVRTWDIGLMDVGEVITYSYDVLTSPDLTAGMYANTAKLVYSKDDGMSAAASGDLQATAVLTYELIAEAKVDVVPVQVLGYESLPETGGPVGVNVTWLGTLLLMSGAYVMRKFKN